MPITSAFGTGRFDPPHQPVDLDVERLEAVVVELVGAGWARRGSGRIGRFRPMSPLAGEWSNGDGAEAVFGPPGSLGGIVEGGRCASGRATMRVAIDIGDAQLGAQREAFGMRPAGRPARRSSPARPMPDRSCSRRARPRNRHRRWRVRADCARHSIWRSSDLPMTMLEADRLHRIVAPASAPAVEGGSGAQKSSQISAKNRKPGKLAEAKTRSVPNGTSCRSPGSSCRVSRARGRTSAFHRTRGNWAGRTWAPRRAAARRQSPARSYRAAPCGAAARRPAAPARGSALACTDAGDRRSRPPRSARPADADRRSRRRTGTARGRPAGRHAPHARAAASSMMASRL